MTRTVASVVTWLSLLGVLLVAGVYTVAYLFTWQWMRAQIAGVAFVAALVLACTLAVLARVRRLEHRLEALLAARHVTATAEDKPEVEPRPDFRWLSRSTPVLALLPVPGLDRLEPPDQAVFIPVFLATGLVLAGIASVVERLAAHRQQAAHPSQGGRAARTTGPFVLVLVICTLVVVAVVAGLWRTTHYRSEALGPGVTTLTVHVDRSTAEGVPLVPRPRAVAVVGRWCAVESGVDVRFLGVAPGPAGTTLLRVAPLLDDAARERYAGCLQDAVLDRHSMTVLATDLSPE